MNNKERIKNFFKKTAEYSKKHVATLTVFLGLLAVGITVAAIFLNAPAQRGQTQGVSDSQDERLEDAMNRTREPENTSAPANEALATVPPSKSTPVPDFTKAPGESREPGTKSLLTPPLSGRVIWGYAMDELIYSETLDQWMTHSGVDIACDTGTAVRSVADGHIERVYRDDELGYTVIIEHENGVRSVYSGLGEEGLAAEGARVKSNDQIGVCGNTAASECALEPHIHFEYHIDGKPVDPGKYVLFTA